MRSLEQLSLIVIISWTLGLAACSGGDNNGNEPDTGADIVVDVPSEDIEEDLPDEDLPGEDVPLPDVGEDIPPDEIPAPDCLEDADCDDDDICTGVEICLDNVCIPGEAVDCGVAGPCDASVECLPDTGECVFTYMDAGTDCDDGLVCNGLAACDDAGVCVPGAAVEGAGAETCVEPDGTLACLAPNWVEDGACVGPALTAAFEDVALGDMGKWIGGGEALWIRSGNARLHNNFDPEWMSWDGFAVSNHTDIETPGFMNDLSAITGGGVHNSATYAVGYHSGFAPAPPTLEILDAGDGVVMKGVFVTNTTYAYLSMLEGDDFAKKFGGEDGTDEDWFLLTIHGLSADRVEVGSVEFYLADFRAAVPEDDYIVAQWAWVDLTTLGPVAGLSFTLSSSDMGEWGMNTPAYFALDDLNRLEPVAGFHDLGLAEEATWDGSDMSGGFQSGNLRFQNNFNPEWMVWDGFAVSTMTDIETTGADNQFSAAAGEGDGDAAYAVAYDGSGFGNPLPTIEVVGPPAVFESLSVTNTTWAWLSMLDGDAFAKKFGGETGEDEDWFLLTIQGLDAVGAVTGMVEHYLADLRFPGASDDDYLLSTWEPVDLTPLGVVAAVQLTLSSSDTGEGGINTPAYVAVDGVALQD